VTRQGGERAKGLNTKRQQDLTVSAHLSEDTGSIEFIIRHKGGNKTTSLGEITVDYHTVAAE